MDLRKVKKLIELVEESGIAELEVSSGDESVRILMPSGVTAVQSIAPPVVGVDSEAVVSASEAAVVQADPANSVAATVIRAPMAGTFYRAPNHDAAPFVEIGQVVAAGDVVCIIESMKMMNEIKAPTGGVVADIATANGTPIGTGAALITLG